MGNHRFRLSNMMPNAWFYKLRDMTRTKNHNPSLPIKKKPSSPTTKPRPIRPDKFYNSTTNPKVSYTHFFDSPIKSSKRKTIYKPSPRLLTSPVSTDYNYRSTLNSVWTNSEPNQDHDYFVSSLEPDLLEFSLSKFESVTIDGLKPINGLAQGNYIEAKPLKPRTTSSCSSRVGSSATDIIINMNEKSFTNKFERLNGFDSISELQKHPEISTKPAKSKNMPETVANFKRNSSKLEGREACGSLSIKTAKENNIKTDPIIRKSVSYCTGVRLRPNSPRLAGKKIQAHGRKSVSRRRSFPIVKSSLDPEKDFRESMVEMIVEHNIRASKELEELLACYLSLNSCEYHDLIVKAFEQIWFNMSSLRK